jgi:membrane protein DedA with SNARE-associated domain
VRIILPVACGVAHVRVPIFLIGSGIGAIVWSTLFALVGWVFGESAMLAIHNARRYEDAIAVGIVVLVLAIGVIFALRARRRGPPRRSVGP